MFRPSRAAALAALVAAAPAAQEAPEPNDTPAQASSLPCPGQAYGSLGAYGDHDLWRVVLAAPATVTLRTTTRGAVFADNGGTSADDTRIDLYGAGGPGAGAPIASNDDRTDRPLVQSGFMSRCVMALGAGTWYLDVYGWSPTGDRGDYAVESVCVAPNPYCPLGISPGGVEVEPNGSAATTNAIGCCAAVGGTITIGDEDWFVFDLSADADCEFAVDADPIGGFGITDPRVYLLDASGAVQLGFDDDSGPGSMARLELSGLAAGSYRIRVTHGDPMASGDYRVTARCRPPTLPLVFADFTMESGSSACLGSGGVPLRIVPRRNEWPQLHATYSFDVAGIASVAVILLGIYPFEPPLDLALFGAPGCLLAVDPAFPALATIPTVPGEAEISLQIETADVNLGRTAVFQAAAIDFGANALGVTTSDRLRITIGSDG